MRLFKLASVFLIGFISGNIFWYLASPLWIDRVVNEQAILGKSDVVINGAFKDADQNHKGSGKVTLSKVTTGSLLRFEDFKVTNGPDLYVWMVASNAIETSSDVKAAEYIEIGALKGNIGNQNYQIPAEYNVDKYGTVVIWCKQFGVLFASAKLK